MANHESAKKRHRQSLKKRNRNRMVKSAVRTAVKKARSAAESNDSNAKEMFVQAESAISSATRKGLFHKRNGSRQISRLHTFIKKNLDKNNNNKEA